MLFFNIVKVLRNYISAYYRYQHFAGLQTLNFVLVQQRFQIMESNF